jgi:hypothetical protein
MEDRKLKFWTLVLVVITAFMVPAPTGMGIESPIGPAIGSPVGNPTVPQTSLSRSGSELIPTDQYNYGADGNRIVTGNVSGGREFRYAEGILPYYSAEHFLPSYFEIETGFGSASLNSFIRRSASSGLPESGLRLNEPYYYPSQTVTSMQRGNELGLEPPRVAFPGGTGEFAPITDSEYYSRQRPLSRSMPELEDVISREIELQKKLTDQEEESLEKELTDVEQFESYLAQQFGKTPERMTLPDKPDELEKPGEPVKPDEPTNELDIREQGEEQPENLFEKPRRETTETDEDSDEPAGGEPDETSDKSRFKSDFEREVTKKLELPEVDHAEAAAIRGPHKTFDDWAQAKFMEYIKAAEDFLKKGKYYKAADAYTLASVYQPAEPLAYIGKALALFGAGEYMSSSYFLEKALTLSPDSAMQKIDLAVLLVDRDMIENHIIEMATWQQQTRAPELAFLMAYIFYQNNNLPAANIATKLASEKMGTNPALLALQKAINIAAVRTR